MSECLRNGFLRAIRGKALPRRYGNGAPMSEKTRDRGPAPDSDTRGRAPDSHDRGPAPDSRDQGHCPDPDDLDPDNLHRAAHRTKYDLQHDHADMPHKIPRGPAFRICLALNKREMVRESQEAMRGLKVLERSDTGHGIRDYYEKSTDSRAAPESSGVENGIPTWWNWLRKTVNPPYVSYLSGDAYSRLEIRSRRAGGWTGLVRQHSCKAGRLRGARRL